MLPALGCGQLPRRQAGEKSIAARELCRLGLAAMDRERFQEARARFSHALRTCPKDAEARHHLARVLWEEGDTGGAITQLREAIELFDGHPEWTVELGEMFLAINDVDAAFICANIATGAEPQLARGWALRGHVLHRQGKFDEALGDFHLARSHGAESIEIQLAVADIYARQDRPARVLASLPETVVDSQQQVIVALQRGQALKKLGRFVDAADALSVAALAQPENTHLQAELAQVQMLAGQPVSADRVAFQTDAYQTDTLRR